MSIDTTERGAGGFGHSGRNEKKHNIGTDPTGSADVPGRWQLRLSEKGPGSSGTDSRYDYLLAEALRQKYVGDVNEAATLFEKCIELDRIRAVPYFELAQMYSARRYGGKAMMYASRAARLEPGNYWYQMASGSLFTQYDLKDSAMVYFARALKADSGRWRLTASWPDFYAEKGDMVKADSLFRRLDSEGGLTEDMSLMMISGLIGRDNMKRRRREPLN
jgi:Tfp pilus assembly protein PilF